MSERGMTRRAALLTWSHLPALVLCSALVAVGSPASAATIRVPADQPTIQAAIDVAAAGDEVLVAPGTYTGPGNKDIHIEVKDVAVRSEEGPAVTIIDCEGSGRGFSLVGINAPLGLIEGFTIQNGDGAGGDPVGGGGMFIGGGTVTVRNCVFRNNAASGLNLNGGGGGISCYGGSPLIEDCVFERNTTSGMATVGGGLAVHQSSLLVRRCRFLGNTAVGVSADGGGIGTGGCDAPQLVPTIEGCEFVGNEARSGGGAFLCNAEIRGCRIEGNRAGGGAGLYAMSTAVVDCTVIGNIATGAGGGIGFDARDDDVISGCYISDNTAASGAGISGVGGTIEYCTITNNVAELFAGGIAVYYRALFEPCAIRHCTVAGNRAPMVSGIYLESTCIAATYPLQGVLVTGGREGRGIQCLGSALVAITCSDLFGNEGGDWIGSLAEFLGRDGNITADPMYCEPGAGDWHLCDVSPCAPAQAGDCGLIGALAVGCSCPIAVEPASWGQVKQRGLRLDWRRK